MEQVQSKEQHSQKSTSIEPFIEPELLQDNADVQGKQSVRHYFTDEELEEFRSQFFETNLNKCRREEIINSVKELMNMPYDEEGIQFSLSEINCSEVGSKSMKELKEDYKSLLTKIRLKFEDRNEMLYGIALFDIGRMAFYKEDGHFVYDRPLNPEERQKSIYSLK